MQFILYKFEDLFSAEISGWKRRCADAAFHHGCKLAKIPQPRLAAVSRHHVGSVSWNQVAESRLRHAERCCQGDVHEDEPAEHRLLCPEDSAGWNTRRLCMLSLWRRALADDAVDQFWACVMLLSLHFAWGIAEVRYILVTRVCLSVCVCLSLAAFPHYCTDPDVPWGNGRGCPVVVHYWADLHSVRGFRCYDNIALNTKCQWVLVLAVCLICRVMALESQCKAPFSRSLVRDEARMRPVGDFPSWFPSVLCDRKSVRPM